MAAVIRQRAMVSMTGFGSCDLYINVCHLTLSIHKVLIINTFVCKFNILYQIVEILRDNIVLLIRFQEFFLVMNSPLSCEELLDTFYFVDTVFENVLLFFLTKSMKILVVSINKVTLHIPYTELFFIKEIIFKLKSRHSEGRLANTSLQIGK